MFLFTVPPSSQKAGVRPISFILTDDSVSPPETNTLEMIIRPEELTRTDASRMTVQQTLGGAWVDSFGPGLTTINISGTTGWRGNPITGSDGMDEFADLQDQTYTDWHRRRNAAVRAGINPAKVQLIFADALDDQIDIVLPMSFTLRRSKSRPLLMQFNIAMIAIPGDISAVLNSASFGMDASPLSALSSMAASVAGITSAIANVASFVQSSILGSVVAFMQTTMAVVNTVASLVATVASIPAMLASTARSVVQAGAILFATIAALPGMIISQVAAAMNVASVYSNIFCLLGNTINQQLIYSDYTPLYGASNCSSTNGGSPISPYSDTNPFYAVMGAPQNAPAPLASMSIALPFPSVALPALTVTPAALQSMSIINNSDPVLAPLSADSIGESADNIATGVMV